jgi:hypothetical protein
LEESSSAVFVKVMHGFCKIQTKKSFKRKKKERREKGSCEALSSIPSTAKKKLTQSSLS